MTDDLKNLDFEEDFENIEEQEPQFDPDNYVKGYIGPNGEIEMPEDNSSDNLGDAPEEDDLLTAFLKSKGITDITKIKMESEDGSIEEKDFNSLSREEQLSILSTPDDTAIEQPQLEDSEIDFLNTLRENNLSVEEYLNWFGQQAVDNYINSEANYISSIDSMTDEELFMADLKDLSPDLTDEECLAALEHEKSSPAWEKRIEGLRNSYKAKEAEKREEEELIRKEEEERSNLEFQNLIQEAVGKVDSIGEFSLDDDDREEIAEFIFGTDKTGVRYFARALNDPETLTRMAWFALNGEEALDTLSKYYKEQIEAYSKANYKKGFEDAQKEKSKPKSTVYKPQQKSNEGVKPTAAPYMIDLD